MNYRDMILPLTFIQLALLFVIYYVSYKKGLDITSHKFAACAVTPILLVFFILPLLLFSGLSPLWKLLAAAGGLGAGILNYFSIDRMQKSLRDKNSNYRGQ